MSYARIAGTGSYVPADTLTNTDLEKLVDTNDEWIMKRVGVRKRHIIGKSGETSITMAKAAALNAIMAANIDPQQIEMIVVATATPEFHFPSNACVLQGELGIKNDIPAFDLNAACAGFIYGLSVVDQYFKSNAIKTALVIGVDGLTKIVNFKDRSTCILFGDGAGAVVLSASEELGILSTHIHANGDYADLIKSNNTIYNPDARQDIEMRGNEVFKIAVTKLGEIVEQTLEKNGYQKSHVDWLIPHQANFRIIKATAKRLNLPLERVILTIEEHGNTSAASVPLALDHAVRKGQIKRGEMLLLEAFGAGLAWGSALVKY
jgi:3-oxoacyl-[acyl-carrier-protein] synthase III